MAAYVQRKESKAVERVNQSELVNMVSERLDLPVSTVKQVVGDFVDAVQSVLRDGDSVSLSGFCSLGTKSRKPRIGRNPQTGEAVKIPAGKRVFLKVSGAFKRALNASGKRSAAGKKASKPKAAKRSPKKTAGRPKASHAVTKSKSVTRRLSAQRRARRGSK